MKFLCAIALLLLLSACQHAMPTRETDAAVTACLEQGTRPQFWLNRRGLVVAVKCVVVKDAHK